MTHHFTPKWLLLLRELRAPFLSASLVPVFLGSALAYYHTGHWDGPLFVWTVLGIAFLHAGANVANDYFDHLSGNDALNNDFVRPFTGGSRMIQNNLLAPHDVLYLFVSCFVAGALIGLYLVCKAGLPVFWLGLIGMAGGYFYTAPPVALTARGWGELTVMGLFGVLPTLGAYFVQTRHFSTEAFVLSLSPAVLILLVLWINQFQDYRADQAAGKRNWVVRLGRRRAARYYAAGMGLWPLPLIACVGLGTVPVWMLLALIPGLIAGGTVPRVLRYYDQPGTLAPANAMTVMLHLTAGAIMSLVLVLAR